MQKSGQFLFFSVLFIYAIIMHICIQKLFSQSRKLMLPFKEHPIHWPSTCRASTHNSMRILRQLKEMSSSILYIFKVSVSCQFFLFNMVNAVQTSHHHILTDCLKSTKFKSLIHSHKARPTTDNICTVTIRNLNFTFNFK